MKVENFGKISDGREAELYTLVNNNGMEVDIVSIGAAIRAIRIPDGNGGLVDCVLGYDNAADYEVGDAFFGAIVGRFAGQVGGASFTLNGETYQLPANDGPNCMHGGPIGFKTRLFDVEIIDDGAVKCSYFSPDLEMGFPGNLHFSVTYRLNDANGLELHFDAVSDKDTILNITNHAYFNLEGPESVSVLDHYLYIDSDAFLANDENGMPYGDILTVQGTPMDFRTTTKVGSRINDDYAQIKVYHGYDHNFCLNRPHDLTAPKAVLISPDKKRSMEVYTTYPGIQFYSGNFLGPDYIGKGGRPYSHRKALCLETQMWPNSYANKHFTDVVVKAGEHYIYKTIYKFNWE